MICFALLAVLQLLVVVVVRDVTIRVVLTVCHLMNIHVQVLNAWKHVVATVAQIVVVVLGAITLCARIVTMIKIVNLNTTIPTDSNGYAVTPIDSWIDALMTRPRMVIGKPNYGTPFPTRKHRSLGNGELIDFRRDFKDACVFDPRLTFEKVDFDLSQVNSGTVGFDVHLSVGIISGELIA
jgi:hypothetical protein